MSEQAKVAYLQEKIKEARRNEIGGLALFMFGLFLIALTLIANSFHPFGLGFFAGIIVGICAVIIGFCVAIYYGVVLLSRFMTESQSMTISNSQVPSLPKRITKRKFRILSLLWEVTQVTGLLKR